MEKFLQVVINSISLGCVYALIALGYSIIYRTMRMGHLAQGEYFMMGAFIAWYFYAKMGLHYIIALILSCVLTVLLMLVFERLVYRRGYSKGFVALLLLTYAVSMVIKEIAKILFSNTIVHFPAYFDETSFAVNIGGMRLLLVPQDLWIAGISAVLMISLTLFMKYSKLGKGMNAVAMNKTAASLMGVDQKQIISATYILSAFMAAIAGVLMAPIYRVEYGMGSVIGSSAMTAAVMGGFGSLPGAMLGGLLLAFAETMGSAYISSAYKNAFSFFLLLLVLFIRPQGILGTKKIEKV